jgi:hypothetical protein
MKFLMTAIFLTLSVKTFACPSLQGRYISCSSESKKMSGEYTFDQHLENDYEVYDVEYVDTETGEGRRDQLITDNVVASRKETIPSIGITVRIEAKTRCEGDSVISEGEAYYFGAQVGTFVNKISKVGNLLKNTFDATYLGNETHKTITCELQ